MKRSIYTIILITTLNIPCFSQIDSLADFTIEGEIDFKTGVVKLSLLSEKEFYPEALQNIQATVTDGKFTITGKLPYPMGFRIDIEGGYSSELIIVSKGYQCLKVHASKGTELPDMAPELLKAYKQYDQYLEVLKVEDEKLDKYGESLSASETVTEEQKLRYSAMLTDSYNKHDAVLLKYVKDHPASYLGFWKFINLTNFGYQPIFDSIYSSFNEELRNTHTGKALLAKLSGGSSLAVNKQFPAISVVDVNNEKLPAAFYQQHSYTLVDLWYSNCAPCIAQFPELITIFNKFGNKGFNIIGVSTDKAAYRQNWIKRITEYQLPWPQFIDTDGVVASKQLFITAYPFNFLLDSTGKIIRINIKPADLNKFLSEHI